MAYMKVNFIDAPVTPRNDLGLEANVADEKNDFLRASSTRTINNFGSLPDKTHQN